MMVVKVNKQEPGVISKVFLHRLSGNTKESDFLRVFTLDPESGRLSVVKEGMLEWYFCFKISVCDSNIERVLAEYGLGHVRKLLGHVGLDYLDDSTFDETGGRVGSLRI